jgi:stearoyl-CoA desaturase (delta-9 desaturase)
MTHGEEALVASSPAMAVIILFVVHWQLSVFCQSFFLHRYGAHRQFSMSPGWERFFNILTAISQNSSYLNPRGYAILHRMHHAYSDTEKDPHSPRTYKGIFPGLVTMMMKTKRIYHEFAYYQRDPEARFDGEFPRSPILEWMGKSWAMRILWGAAFVAFYYAFATAPWQWALLPFHWTMGAVHGAIVNWGGHRYGYRNFELDDISRNTLPIDFLTAGELYQNNHHKFPMSPNFAARWWEVDTTYLVMRVLNRLGIIELRTGQKMRWAPVPATETAARALGGE